VALGDLVAKERMSSGLALFTSAPQSHVAQHLRWRQQLQRRTDLHHRRQRGAQRGEPVLLMHPDDGAQDDLERDGLHPGQHREPVTDRPASDLLGSDSHHLADLPAHRVAVEGGQHHPAAAPVRLAV
jgi:hypothetical protein